MTEIPSNEPLAAATPTPVVTTATAKPGIFGTKIPASVAFIIGIILFLMPFIDIRCNNMTLQTVTGVELATGFQVKGPGSENSLFGKLDSMGSDTTTSSTMQKKDPNVYALAALIIAVAGLLLSLFAGKAGGAGALATGLGAAVALIIVFIDVKGQLKNEMGMNAQGNNDLGLDGSTVISVDFTGAFYISVICFLAAAYFGYRRMKEKPHL